ncbi:MAG: hypothetical protein IIC31_04000 [Chloroflexi bacterium]|nr:hypothetical protein [Chloroflexota bacterium]
MTISLSHGSGETMYASAEPSSTVLVGTVDGVARIERNGAGWSVTERTLRDHHIHALLFEAESGTWFAGVQHGGIFASTDGGSTWERRDAGLTEDNVYSLSKATLEGKVRLFAGTEPAKLFVSDDLGRSWAEKPHFREDVDTSEWTFPGPPHEAHLKHINFAPGNPHTILGSVEVGGLFKSTDDGESWAEITGVYEDVHRCVVDASDGDHMFVTGGMGLWVTTDGGDTWSNPYSKGSEPGGYPDQLVFKPSDPRFMIMSAGQHSPGAWRKDHTAQTRISRSRDGGETWEVLSGGLEDKFQHAVEAMCLEEAGGTVRIFAATTGGDVLLSEDAGDTWTTVVSDLAPISKGGHYKPLAAQAVS